MGEDILFSPFIRGNMGRHKKNKSIELEKKEEVVMSTETMEPIETLDNLESEIDRTRQELESIKLELAEKKQQSKSMAMREVDEEEMIIVKKHNNRTAASAGLKDKIEKQKAYDNVKVTGKFLNRLKPGQTEKLPYMKYEDDVPKWWTFIDGHVYTIPRGFADQINGGTDNDPMYYKPIFIEKQGQQVIDPTRVGENSSIGHVDTSNKKYQFVPISF
jgi:hypothetical protein